MVENLESFSNMEVVEREKQSTRQPQRVLQQESRVTIKNLGSTTQAMFTVTSLGHFSPVTARVGLAGIFVALAKLHQLELDSALHQQVWNKVESRKRISSKSLFQWLNPDWFWIFPTCCIRMWQMNPNWVCLCRKNVVGRYKHLMRLHAFAGFPSHPKSVSEIAYWTHCGKMRNQSTMFKQHLTNS